VQRALRELKKGLIICQYNDDDDNYDHNWIHDIPPRVSQVNWEQTPIDPFPLYFISLPVAGLHDSIVHANDQMSRHGEVHRRRRY
jgi:hypothetical protein